MRCKEKSGFMMRLTTDSGQGISEYVKTVIRISGLRRANMTDIRRTTRFSAVLQRQCTSGGGKCRQQLKPYQLCEKEKKDDQESFARGRLCMPSGETQA